MKLHLSTIIGIITGFMMIIVSVLIFRLKGGFDNFLQYIPFALFAGSVIFSQKLFSRNTKHVHSLKNYFSEGFKTFIVITLLMVAFTRVFIGMTPELSDMAAEMVRIDLITKGNKTPDEINNDIQLFRENYPNIMTSVVIFRYLAIGSLVALVGGLYFSRRQSAGKKNIDS